MEISRWDVWGLKIKIPRTSVDRILTFTFTFTSQPSTTGQLTKQMWGFECGDSCRSKSRTVEVKVKKVILL